MKKLLSVLIFLATVVPSFAVFNGSGYYRIENETSHRFATMQDNHGSLNTHTGSADVAAVKLVKGFENVFSDPASVLYLEKVSGSGNTSQLDIKAQGVSMYSMISHYLQLRDNGDGTYYAYGSSSGMTLYLCDPEKSNRSYSYLGTQSQGYRKWYINPINTSVDAGFGVKSEVTVAGENYAPFFAGFPFSPYSPNMEVYYINKVDSKYGIAIMEKATGTIPAGIPVFIKCNSSDPASNLLNIGGTPNANISNNLLKGVYFDNDSPNHYNRTPYDKKTMRIFGITSEGKLGFITEPNREFLPQNRAYLTVAAGSPDQFTIMSAAEYDKFIASIPVDPESLDITNTFERVKVGSTLALNLVVKPDNAKKDDLKWTSSDNSVATVDQNGVVTGVAYGECTITATLGKFTDQCKVHVYGQNNVIILDKTEVTLYEGEDATLQAKIYADADYQLTWASSDEKVATVKDGKITAVSMGTAQITVSGGNAKATCTVTVKRVYVDPESLDITNTFERVKVGSTLALNLVVEPYNAKMDDLKWTSSDNSVATVDQNGVVTGVALGECYITATLGKFTDQCKVHVYGQNNVIILDKTEVTLYEGEDATLQAKIYADADYQLTWTSSDEKVATVKDGKITAVSMGTAQITVSGGNAKATCTVNVKRIYVDAESLDITNTFERVKVGSTLALNLVVEPYNAKMDDLKWTSSDNNVATVDHNGVVTGVALGECYITATLGKFTDQCKVLVYGENPVIVLDKEEVTLYESEEATLQAKLYADADYQFVWSSSDEKVATVKDGKITAVNMGTAVITVTAGSAKATCTVNVKRVYVDAESLDITNTFERVKVGSTLALNLVVEPYNAKMDDLKWTSSDNNVATVDQNGVVTGVALGECYITATLGKFTDQCKVHVYGQNNVIILDRTEVTLYEGEDATLQAKIYADADYQLTWASSDEKVATVKDGKITAVSMGTAEITVSGGNAKATCTVTVQRVYVDPESLDITNTFERVKGGSTLVLNLVVEPYNAKMDELMWTSSDNSVATVDQNGVVTGVSFGECYITATLGNLSDSCRVLVYGEDPVIILSDNELTLTEGDVVTVEAKLYADDDYQLTWTSSDESVVTVDDGTITAILMGSAMITVSCGDVEETCLVIVNDITGISSVIVDQNGPFDVYTLQGVCVLRNVRSLEGLQKGLYIINGTKVLIK